MVVIRVERPVRAPPDVVWAVISDVEAISEYAANVSRAEADGEGEGMRRRCWNHDGDHWDEACRLWEEGERYSFAVDTASSGERMHRLFESFVGTFGVDEVEAGEVEPAGIETGEVEAGEGGTGVVEAGEGGTGSGSGPESVVWAAFDLRPRFGPVGTLLFGLVRPMARRGIEGLVENWVDEIESRHAATASAAAE